MGEIGEKKRKWGISFLVKTKRKILRKTGSNKKNQKDKKDRKDEKRRKKTIVPRGGKRRETRKKNREKKKDT